MPKVPNRTRDDLRADILLEVFTFAEKCVRQRVPDHDIQDVAGDVTLAMIHRIDAEPECLESRRKFFGYVKEAAHNEATNFGTSNKRRTEREARHAEHASRYVPDWSAADAAVFNEESTVVGNAAIDQLPEPYREAFRLVQEQRLSFVDAAKVLGVNANTVSRRFNAALAQLSASLTDYTQTGRHRLTAPLLPLAQRHMEPEREATP